MSYYKVVADTESSGRPSRLAQSAGRLLELSDEWYLDDLVTSRGEVVFDDDLKCCRAFPSERLTVTLKYDGTARDFSFTLAHVPVVNARVAEILKALAGNDAQLIPAQIRGHSGSYAVVNVLRCEDCIIEGRSMYSTEYWIDAAKANRAMILRPSSLKIVLLVGQELRDALVRENVTGARFKCVSE